MGENVTGCSLNSNVAVGIAPSLYYNLPWHELKHLFVHAGGP